MRIVHPLPQNIYHVNQLDIREFPEFSAMNICCMDTKISELFPYFDEQPTLVYK